MVALLAQRQVWALACLCALAAAGFVATRVAAAAERASRRADAERWYAVGERALATGRHALAIDALRHATAIDRNNPQYQLALSSALSANGQDAVARMVLLPLRSRMPEDPKVNLQLARLEARRRDLSAAVRYYQNALHGVWNDEDGEGRRDIRLELVRYLLDSDQQSRAVSELLALAANVPDDPALQMTLGELYLEAEEPGRAAEAFTRILRRSPGTANANANANAHAGLGEALFRLGDYRRAQRELAAAPKAMPRVSRLRTVTDLILGNDPLMPRVTMAARKQRLETGLQHALSRLDRCLARAAPDVGVDVSLMRELRQETTALTADVTRTGTMRDPPAKIETVVELIGRIERALSTCGPVDPLSEAWMLIARRHAVE
jgi:tetratricopeptide (TPR) repeat protein